MKKKIILPIAGLIFILVAGVVIFTQTPLASILAREANVQSMAPSVESQLAENTTEEQSIALVANLQEDEIELPEAQLDIIEDEVYYFDLEAVKFVLIEDESMKIQEGACIRTGKEGMALITFAEDITLNLEANTEICLIVFSPDSEDPDLMNLTVELSIGNVFFMVNIPEEQAWDVKLITSTGYVWSADLAFSYYASVIYKGTEQFDPEEMEVYIANHAALNPKTVCFTEDNERYLCNQCVDCAGLVAYNPVKVVVQNESGDIAVTYLQIPEGFETVWLIPAEKFEYAFVGYSLIENWLLLCQTVKDLAAGEEILPSVIEKLTGPEKPPAPTQPFPLPKPTIVIVDGCGDGICDIYAGENATNCPEDCP